MHNCAMQYFCGLPKTAPALGYAGDMGWTPQWSGMMLTIKLCGWITPSNQNKLYEYDMQCGGE